jgi:hypothetical protein
MESLLRLQPDPKGSRRCRLVSERSVNHSEREVMLLEQYVVAFPMVLHFVHSSNPLRLVPIVHTRNLKIHKCVQVLVMEPRVQLKKDGVSAQYTTNSINQEAPHQKQWSSLEHIRRKACLWLLLPSQ